MRSDNALRISALELDALTELVNIGVSKAAASLREMVQEEVILSVPSVQVVERAEASRLIGEEEQGKLVAINQMFSGDLRGRALLIFPETNSLELVKAVMGGELSLDDIIDLEQEALSETGNIILNNCLGTIGNLLHRTMRVSLPEILRGEGRDFFESTAEGGKDEVVLFLFINFSIKSRAVRGYIAMLMDLPVLDTLRGLLQEYIARMTEEMSVDNVRS
jgi:chemotaxis protein CheC